MKDRDATLIAQLRLRVRDLDRARAFYVPLLETIGYTLTSTGEDFFCVHELHVSAGAEASANVHLKFTCDNPALVRIFHETALVHGGRCNGAPACRPFRRKAFSACVLDPDGISLEVVYRPPGSAEKKALKPLTLFQESLH